MENEKGCEKNWLYTATATAKRFSSTSDYAGQHITQNKTLENDTTILFSNAYQLLSLTKGKWQTLTGITSI